MKAVATLHKSARRSCRLTLTIVIISTRYDPSTNHLTSLEFIFRIHEGEVWKANFEQCCKILVVKFCVVWKERVCSGQKFEMFVIFQILIYVFLFVVNDVAALAH